MKTTGSICVNANLSKNDAGIWGCTYQKYDLAHEIQFGEDFRPTKNDMDDDSIEKVLHDKTKVSCGHVKPSDFYLNPKNKPETISKNRPITDNTRGEVIVASLQNLYEYRKNNIKNEIYEKDKKDQYPNYSDQIEQFENHIKKSVNILSLVRENVRRLENKSLASISRVK
jgi:hypothetical protein